MGMIVHSHSFSAECFGTMCSLTCAWRQAAIAEHATCIGNHAVSALLDIERAFDSVAHDLIRRQAVVQGYDMNILRFLIKMYGMKRIIMVERVLTKPVVATRSIVLGDSNADALMHAIPL